MHGKLNLTSLITLASERVVTNSEDGNLLPVDALPEAVNEVKQFLRHAQPGDPLPSKISDMPSVQLLQIVFEIQQQNT